MASFPDCVSGPLDTVKTPCIGVCSTGIGGDVCRGCKRYSHEIIHWNGLSLEQRRAIDRRLAQLLAQVMDNHVCLVDVDLLVSRLTHYQIEFNASHPSLCWLYALLRAGASQIKTPEAYGFHVKHPETVTSLRALKRAVDKDFYALSCAHYERYFAQPAAMA